MSPCLANELERLGVEDALRAAGAKPGEEILLGAHSFTLPTAGPAGAGRVRVGVFGGEFDPPHLAHVAVARAARDQLALDRRAGRSGRRATASRGIRDAGRDAAT